jgi:hypothetical protein
MVQGQIGEERNSWSDYYAWMMQQFYKKGIEEAIEKVKREVPVRKHKCWRRK